MVPFTPLVTPMQETGLAKNLRSQILLRKRGLEFVEKACRLFLAFDW